MSTSDQVIAAIAISLWWCGGSAAAEPGATTWTTFLYDGPGARHRIIDEPPQGTRVEVASCTDGWCKVSIGRLAGYLRADVVSRADAEGVLAQPATSTTGAGRGPCFTTHQTGAPSAGAVTRFCAQ